MSEAALEAVRAYLDAYAGAATPIPALAERGAVHLAAAGLPGGAPESWRYTDPGELLARRFAVEAAPVEAPDHGVRKCDNGAGDRYWGRWYTTGTNP